MTMLGDALRPTLSEGEPGRCQGGKAIETDMGRLYFSFDPLFILYNHIMSCTSCRCPCADLSMFITLMFLSRRISSLTILLSPHFSVLIIDYAM